jgi:Tfp pilus assembly protein PilF
MPGNRSLSRRYMGMHTDFWVPEVGGGMFDRLFKPKTDHVGRARQLFSDKRYPEAEEEIKKAIASNPKDAENYYQIGILYFENQSFSSAIDPLERALQLNPALFQAHHMLGFIFMQRGWSDVAEDHLKKAIQIHPQLPNSHYLLGNLYTDKKLWDRALEHYRKALALAPDTAEFQACISKVEQQKSFLEGPDDQIIELVQRDRSYLPELSKRKNAKTFEALKGFISINEGNFHTRAKAMTGLLDFKDFPVNEALRDYIDDNFGSFLSSSEGHAVMEIAVRNLKIADDPDALNTLFRFSGTDEYADCYKLALQKITDLGPRALSSLYPYLESRSFHERFFAVKIIGQIGDPSAITPLEELYRREEGWSIRNMIIKFVIRFPDPGLQDFLLDALGTETNEGIRYHITGKFDEYRGTIQAVSRHFETAETHGDLIQMLHKFPVADIENFCRYYPIEQLRLDLVSVMNDNRFEKCSVLVQIFCDYPDLTKKYPEKFPGTIPAQKLLDILVKRLVPFVKRQRKEQIAGAVKLWMVDMGLFLMKVQRPRDALVFLELAYPSGMSDHYFAIAAACSNIALAEKAPEDIERAREKLDDIITGRVSMQDEYVRKAGELLGKLEQI